MSIKLLYRPEDKNVADIIRCGLLRSFSAAQVSCASFGEQEHSTSLNSQIYVLLNPSDAERSLLETLAAQNRKVILFGSLGTQLAADIGIEVEPLGAQSAHWAKVQPSADLMFNASRAAVVYDSDHPLTASLGLRHRPLSRYDFTDEWNTLGFGRIAVDGGLWSLCQQAGTIQARAIAQVVDRTGNAVTAYATLTETSDSSLLWFNRAVGPVDSLEWTLIETFCSQYQADSLACIPYLSEIPAGYSGTVTMRLDCDQAIATARPLFELYQDLEMPLSLAIVTGLPPQPDDMAFLRDVLAHGGAAVSHSRTHPTNWGADYSAALQEAQQSKAWLETHLPEATPIRYAVSPFHQNPSYAVKALADAGYLGFVGGIIHNDPEYLLGRSGQVPLCEQPLISHSQQCMLHGDCYHRYGDSVTPYYESFQNHVEAGYLFGYLDHPFSSTYQYGWQSESERLSAHADLIKSMRSHGNIWFANVVQCLEFARKRSLVGINIDKNQSLQIRCNPISAPLQPTPPVQVSWRGETIPVSA